MPLTLQTNRTNGLNKDSYVMAEKNVTVDKSILGERIDTQCVRRGPCVLDQFVAVRYRARAFMEKTNRNGSLERPLPERRRLAKEYGCDMIPT